GDDARRFHARPLGLPDRSSRPSADFFFSSRRRHTRLQGDWSSDVCSFPNPASPNFNAEGLGLTGFQYPWKTGYTQEWNAAFEYQFTPNQSITLQYIGNTSRHLLNGDKRNVTTEILPPGTACCKSYIPFPD